MTPQLPPVDPTYKSDLLYLAEELEWLEARIVRLTTTRKLAGMEGKRERKRRRWEDEDEESPRDLVLRSNQAREREDERRATIDGRLAAHRATGAPPLALDRLCQRCGLDELERTILLLAAAPCFSQRFENLYGELLGETYGSGATVELVYLFAELSFEERIERRSTFSPRSRLLSQDLVTCEMSSRYRNAKDLLCAEVELGQRTFAFLTGRDELDDEFHEFSSMEEPKASFDHVVLAEHDLQRIRSVIDHRERYLASRAEWGFDDLVQYGRGSLMLFYGPPGTGKTMTAHAVAHHLGKRIFNVDIPTFIGHRDAERFLPGLFREARLQDALLFFDECELLFGSRRAGNELMTMLLTELERFDGVAVLATNLPQQLDQALARRILVRVRFPEPDMAARARIWANHLPRAAPVSGDVDVDVLAERFELTGGYIKNAVLAAVAAAVCEAETTGVEARIGMSHLLRAAGDQIERFDDAGEPIAVPAVRLDDVVLPPESATRVRDLLAAVRASPHVRRAWGVGGPAEHRAGLAALFSGPPGTGKTLCAEALAGELGRPLMVGRAPMLLSKWVGETERNIETLFRRARAQQAVVLLDEVDGLLMDRQDSRSRYELTLVNTLLELVERHPGLVLLSTNLPDRLDAGLLRRLSRRICFPQPGAAEREQLWRRMLPATAPLAPDVDLPLLARRYELSGAQIRQAALAAAIAASRAGGSIRQEMLAEAASERTEAKARAVGFGSGTRSRA